MGDDIEIDAEPVRLNNGRFARGSSGNPSGRPPKVLKKHSMPYNNARAVIEVAELPVRLKRGDKTEEVTLYQAVVRSLGQRAANGDLRATRMFLDEMKGASSFSLYHSELVKTLLEQDTDQEGFAKMVADLFPKVNGGVFYDIGNGDRLPAKWYDSIRKLGELEAREAALEMQEKAIQDEYDKLFGKDRTRD